MSFYQKYGKRIFDLCLTIPLFIVLSPVMGITAILVAVKLGRPVLFTQERPGYHEKIFRMYKFRSMTDERDETGELLPDEVRLTKFGERLRSTSLDELPELLNILKGDMSIVGPRPLPSNYLPWFKEEERIRHTVRGGLTGLAQVHGRNTASWEKRFRYDAEYAANISFLRDVKIVMKTMKVVLKRSDIGVRGEDTPVDFHVYRSGLSERELLELKNTKEREKCVKNC